MSLHADEPPKYDDAQQYGAIVDGLVGFEFERSLAVNSLKLRFETHVVPKGLKYIWIDPPWQLFSPNGLVTSSGDYEEDNFAKWSELFAPLNKAIFTGWTVNESGETTFAFGNGYRLLLPATHGNRDDDSWYDHWYAQDNSV